MDLGKYYFENSKLFKQTMHCSFRKIYTNKLPFYDIRLTCKASKSHFGTGPCMNTYLKNSGNAVFFSSRLFQKKSSTSPFSHFTKMNESGDTTIHLDRWYIEKKKGALTLLETLYVEWNCLNFSAQTQTETALQFLYYTFCLISDQNYNMQCTDYHFFFSFFLLL